MVCMVCYNNNNNNTNNNTNKCRNQSNFTSPNTCNSIPICQSKLRNITDKYQLTCGYDYICEKYNTLPACQSVLREAYACSQAAQLYANY